jgi:hypothetical protein
VCDIAASGDCQDGTGEGTLGGCGRGETVCTGVCGGEVGEV